MKNDIPLEERIRRMINKSLRSIEMAKELAALESHDFAVARAYYGVFYAMEAVLLTQDLIFSKHQGVIGAFNKNFIKTGIFPKEFGRQISRLFRERQNADYEFDSMIPDYRAEEDIQAAEEIVIQIIQYLKREGFIESSEDKDS